MSKISVGCLSGPFAATPLRSRLLRFRATRALWVALGGAALLSTASSFAAQTNWVQTYLGAGHTSYNSAETTLSKSNIADVQMLRGQRVAGGVTSFALDAGTIFAQGQGSSTPNLVAINAASGETLWTITTGNDGFGLTNSIAAGGGRVFAGCGFAGGVGGICAYNQKNGKLLWSYTNSCSCLPESEIYAPLVYADGVVYFGYGYGGAGGGEYIVAANETSGDVLWTFSTGSSNTLGSAAPAVGNGMIYFTCGGKVGGSDSFSGVCAVSKTTQELVWAADFGTGTMGLTLGGDVLYVNAGSIGEFAALNATTGATLWTAAGNSSAFPVSIANNILYATGSDGYVHRLRAQNGTEIWSLNLASETSVSVANGVLYDDQQGSNNPATAAYATSDGSLLWSTPLPASTLHPPPLIANGILYVTNASCGNVCAYGLPEL